MKRLIRSFVFILLFLGISSSFNAQENKTRIDVLYFHATTRCQGCLKIEDNIKKSVDALYEKQLKDSSIVYSSIDFLQDENAHYQDDYKFDTQTLIISKKVNGKEVKWVNLDKIWDYSGDYMKFRKYVEEEINNLLKEA